MSSYGAGYGGASGAGYDSGSGGDERSKVQLGIRLRIPAIKFELPRFNLPKITVSAKIRQPDGPRTITLPEINLDTSSKTAAPSDEEYPQQGGYHGGYSSPSQYQPSHGKYQQSSSYGGGQEQTSSFTFSTEEVKSPGGGGGGYGYGYGHGSGHRINHGFMRQNYMPPPYFPRRQHGYSATNIQPSYIMSGQQINHREQIGGTNKNPDIGLNALA